MRRPTIEGQDRVPEERRTARCSAPDCREARRHRPSRHAAEAERQGGVLQRAGRGREGYSCHSSSTYNTCVGSMPMASSMPGSSDSQASQSRAARRSSSACTLPRSVELSAYSSRCSSPSGPSSSRTTRRAMRSWSDFPREKLRYLQLNMIGGPGGAHMHLRPRRRCRESRRSYRAACRARWSRPPKAGACRG